VFPVRYELNSYMLFGRNPVLKGLINILIKFILNVAPFMFQYRDPQHIPERLQRN
jgi:hypothetical protein